MAVGVARRIMMLGKMGRAGMRVRVTRCAVNLATEVVMLVMGGEGLATVRVRGRDIPSCSRLLIPRPQASRMVPPTPLMETYDFLWFLPFRAERAAHLS